MIGISACLGGSCCRYDGTAKTIPELQPLIETGKAVLICPEVLGGLEIPREPAEIVGGDGWDVWTGKASVLTISGKDVTAAFKTGAKRAYKKLKEQQITHLLTKENSPSCGKQLIYDGRFSGMKKAGVGVAVAYFEQHGINVMPESKWKQVLEEVELHE
ncbi:2-thiouracil desulfurase family protein [Enterococcus sp. LJL128]